MDFEIKTTCSGIDWQAVADTLKSVGMAYAESESHQKAFEASHSTVFVYDGDRLVGFGRALSDGVNQAAVYDCAVRPEFQGQGIGRMIIEHILAEVAGCNVILYASPGKEGFYETLGFRKMKTGMAKFVRDAEMIERGFTE